MVRASSTADEKFPWQLSQTECTICLGMSGNISTSACTTPAKCRYFQNNGVECTCPTYLKEKFRPASYVGL